MVKLFTSLQMAAAVGLIAGCVLTTVARADDGGGSRVSSRRVARLEDAAEEDNDAGADADEPKVNTYFLRSSRPNSSRKVMVTQATEELPDDGSMLIPGPEFGPTPDDDTTGAANANPNGLTCDTCGACLPACRCCMCGPPGRFWLRTEYVGWQATGGHVPALVTSGNDPNALATNVVYGNGNYNGGFRSGVFVNYGAWLDCCRNWGLQGDYFYVGPQSSPFFASSDGQPVLARPFTDANSATPSEQLIASPGTVVGSVSISNQNALWGTGAFLRHNLCCWNDCCNTCNTGCGNCFQGQNCCRLDFITGFRYYRFNDRVGINEQLTSIDTTNTALPVGTQFNVTDSFNTANNFYGGEIGLILDSYRRRWMWELGARVALGVTQQIVTINGNTVISFPGQPTAVDQGGLLALSSNIGNYHSSSFSAIPMLSGRIGYRLTERFTVLFGYTAIYWGRVARAGDQIDTTVNTNLIPPPIPGGPQRPEFTLNKSDLFLQGITIGGEYYF